MAEPINISVDLTGFNRVMANVADTLGANTFKGNAEGGRRFVKYQAGALVSTLIRVTPPTKRAETAKRIEDRVNTKFHLLSNPQRLFAEHQAANGGDVNWYAFTPRGIYGVAQDYDLTNATVAGLYATYFQTKTNKMGRIIVGKRGKQTIYLWQKYTVNSATVKKLIERLKKHIGRLKAGWTVAWNKLGQPGQPVPGWITRHENGARGDGIDGLGIPDQPSFTLINRALGIDKAKFVIHSALEIRMKAMVADMKLIIAGKKENRWRN